jgi:hypothetical protein
MERFKTKQEAKEFKGTVDYNYLNRYSIWSLPIENSGHESQHWGKYLTTDPHPFDNLDIKVRVSPKQSKKLQKKAFKMGYKWKYHENILRCTEHPFIYIEMGKIDFDKSCHEADFNNYAHTELTYKQFMNGTVPKKEFKVGDWVKVVGFNSYSSQYNPTKKHLKDDCKYQVINIGKYEGIPSIAVNGDYGGWNPPNIQRA